MLNRVVVSVVLISLLTTMFAVGVRPVGSVSATITVPDDYLTIQEAVNNASDGATVFVRNGTYYENIFVNKPISLIGESKYGTIINSSVEYLSVLDVESDNVSVTGFTIRGGGFYGLELRFKSDCNISDNVISDSYGGVYILGCQRTIFSGNIITNHYIGAILERLWESSILSNSLMNNTYPCRISDIDGSVDFDASNLVDGKPIYCLSNQENTIISAEDFPEVGYLALSYSTNVTIRDIETGGISLSYSVNCTVENCTISHSWAGIFLIYESNDTIRQNTIKDSDQGIWLVLCNSYADVSTSNSVIGNIVSGNSIGIKLSDSGNNLVRNNKITRNGVGIGIIYPVVGNVIKENDVSNNEVGIWSYIVDSRIFHNNFVNNTRYDIFSIDTLDNGYPSGGNYWSEYNGTDLYKGPFQNETGSDGIGDTPYFLGSNSIIDNFPLMKPYTTVWDVNRDGIVDIRDLSIATKAFGTVPSDQRWNPLADVTGPDGVPDGKIDIRDIALIAKNFGKTYQY